MIVCWQWSVLWLVGVIDIPQFSQHFCWLLYLWLINDFLSFFHFYRKFHSTWMTSWYQMLLSFCKISMLLDCKKVLQQGSILRETKFPHTWLCCTNLCRDFQHLLLTCFPCNKSSIDSFMNVWLPRHACHNCMHMWATVIG